MGRRRHDPNEPIVIKKYANRRLYDTATSMYITLDDLCEMVRDKLDFVVRDAKTNEDLTQATLTQVIVDKEAAGANLLPTTFLKQLIGFYGEQNAGALMLPKYLAAMMDSFVQNQTKFRGMVLDAQRHVAQLPFTFYEELKKQQQAVMDGTMSFWTGKRDT